MNNSKEPKKELALHLYTKQLHSILKPIMFSGFDSLYDEVNKVYSHDYTKKFEEFLKILKAIPKWSNKLLDLEVKRIKIESNLNDYLDKLFDAIILTSILLMTATPNNKKNRIKYSEDITFTKFIHIAYIKSAEQLFNNSILMDKSVDDNTRNSNISKVMTIITDGIDEAITTILPLQYILDKFMMQDFETTIQSEKEKEKDIKIIPKYSEKDIKIIPKYSEKDIKIIPKYSEKEDEKDIILTSKYSEKEDEKEINEEFKEQKNNNEQIILEKNNDIIELSIIKPKSSKKSNNEPFNISNIPQKNPDESEAYYKTTNKTLDIFSNKQYEKETPKKNSSNIDITKLKVINETPDIATSDIKKYALNFKDKKNNIVQTENSTSIRNYIIDKK